MKNIRWITLLALLLLLIKANAQTVEKYPYYPKLPKIGMDEMNKAKSVFQDKIKGMNDNIKFISVFNDRFEITLKKSSKTIYFSDQYKVQIFKVTNPPVPPEPAKTYYRLLNFEELSNIYYTEPSELEEFADYFFYFQHRFNVQQYDSLTALFKPLAAQYCALKVKPQVSEVQRKYIVQANVLNQQKMYQKAIELYNKANEIDQTAYPAAYSNLALLSAQLYQFDAAIYYMNKFLLLEPEASEARSAQDKIYEWEIMMQK
jgi:tetratricopeptide (TPR) repeat protein